LTEELNYTSEDWRTLESAVAHLVDINGDMLPDRVLRQNQMDNFSYQHFQVQNNSGSSLGTRYSMNGLASRSPVYSESILNVPYASTGDGGATLATLIDMNGDGRADRVIVGQQDGTFDVQLNTGT